MNYRTNLGPSHSNIQFKTAISMVEFV